MITPGKDVGESIFRIPLFDPRACIGFAMSMAHGESGSLSPGSPFVMTALPVDSQYGPRQQRKKLQRHRRLSERL